MKSLRNAPPEFWVILALAVAGIAWTVYLQVAWSQTPLCYGKLDLTLDVYQQYVRECLR